MKLIIMYILIMLACLNLASRASASQSSKCKLRPVDAKVLSELVEGDDPYQASQYLDDIQYLDDRCKAHWREVYKLDQHQ